MTREPKTTPRHTLVGRQQELALLRETLERAIHGRGTLVLLSGEAGIGKTRLARAIAEEAEDRRVNLAWGRSWDIGGAPAFWPWKQVLSSVHGGVETELLSPAGADPAERFKMFFAVLESLRSAANRSPWLIVMDDVHAADAASLFLLDFVARDLPRMSILAVATVREDDATHDPEARAILAQLARDATTIQLTPIAQAEAEQLVMALGEDVPSPVRDRIVVAGEGNPLFLSELVRSVRAFGPPAFEGALAMPRTLRETIRKRCALLSPSARDVCEAAAAIGGEIQPGLLAAVSGKANSDLAPLLSEAVAVGLLRETAAGGYSFRHGLVRDAIERDLHATQRFQLHRRIADVLTTRSGLGDEPLSEIAHHLLEAGPDARDAAVSSCIRASEQALDQLAFEHAIGVLLRAWEVIALVPSTDRLKADLFVAIGRARTRAGDVARGKESSRRAVELAERLEDAGLLARAALAYGMEYTVGLVDPFLVATLQRAHDRLDGRDAALRARVAARLAAALQPARDPSAPLALARASLTELRGIADMRIRLDGMLHAISAMMDFADPRERMALNCETLELARALDDGHAELRATLRLVFDSIELGEIDWADERIDAFELMGQKLRSSHLDWVARMLRAMRAVADGRFEEDDRLVEDARAIGQARDPIESSRCIAFHRFGRLRAEERNEDLLRFEPELRAVAAPHGPEYQNGISASIFARAGDLDRARACLSTIRLGGVEITHDPFLAVLLAESVAAIVDREGAEALLVALGPMRERVWSWGRWAGIYEGPVARHLGLLAGALDRVDEAIWHLEYAHERTIAIGATAHVARVRRELVAALERRGHRKDIERALSLGENSAPRRSSLLPASPSAPLRLSREGEYWTIVTSAGEIRLRDSRGLQILARLIDEPDREFHVLDLASSSAEAVDTGDAGELLDPRARAAYSARLEDLRDDLAETEGFADALRASRIRAEMDFITGELARATGLGGRGRRAAGAVERARSAVGRRVRDAIRKIHAHERELGAHLEWAVQTGTFCAYRPHGRP